MFTIKYVSQKTGLTTHAIRVWERRYGVVKPIRTDTNRRLYSEQDVQKLSLLKQAKLSGQPIGRLIELELPELENLVRDLARPFRVADLPHPNTAGDSTEQYVIEALEAVKAFDMELLEKILDEASISFSQPDLVDHIIVPFLHRVGEQWFDGEMRVAQEHGASEVVRRLLGRMISGNNVVHNAPLLITATVAGLFHEFGAMLATIAAASQGWKAEYLGNNLPVEEIVFAARQKKASAVAISIVYPSADQGISEQLLRLHQLLPENVLLLISGWASESYKDSLAGTRAIFLADLTDLRRRLQQIR